MDLSKNALISVLTGESNSFLFDPLGHTTGLDMFPYMLSVDRDTAKKSCCTFYETETADRRYVLIDRAYDEFDKAEEFKLQISEMIDKFDSCMFDAIRVSNIIAFIRELAQYPELTKELNLSVPEIPVKTNRAELFQYVLENDTMIDAIVAISALEFWEDCFFGRLRDDCYILFYEIFLNVGRCAIGKPMSKDAVINALKVYSTSNIMNTVNKLFASSELKNLMKITAKLRRCFTAMATNRGDKQYDMLCRIKRDLGKRVHY